MIDEKRIHQITTWPPLVLSTSGDDLEELARLARLGIWAEAQGIEAIESYVYNFESEQGCQCCDNNGSNLPELKEALAAIPKP